MINGAIKRALQVAKMRAGHAPATHVPTPPQAPPPKREDMPVDPTRSKSAQERQKFDGGGSIMFQKEEQPRKNIPLRPYEPRFNPKSGKLDAADRKDIGFYGPIKNPMTDHEITEYSSDRDFQYPTVYEGMSDKDRAAIMMAERLGKNAPKGALDDVDDRAYAQAKKRKAKGRSPFYEPGKDPYPKWSPEQHWDEPTGMQKDDGLYYADGGTIEDPPKKEYAPFNVLPFREDETGIHFDKNAGLLGPITRGLKIARQAAPTWMGGEGHYDPNNPEDFKATQDLAGLAFGSGTAFNKAPKGAIGSFAGPRAEGVNLDTYREAQKAFREANFMDPQTERSMAARYGWSPYGRDPKTGDLRLFTELSDAPATFTPNFGTQKYIQSQKEKAARIFDEEFSGLDVSSKTRKAMIDDLVAKNVLNKGVSGPLGDFYNNPAVFSAYPGMENLKFQIVPKAKLSNPNTSAEYRYSRKGTSEPHIDMAKNVAKSIDADGRKILGHEVQHRVQHIENTLGPISDFEGSRIPNPAVQVYEEALATNPKLQEMINLEHSPDIVRVKDIFRDQFSKRKGEILRSRDGVVDIDANKAALAEEISAGLQKHFPEYERLRTLEKELRDQGIPTARPSEYLTDTEAYLTSQDEAQARNTEYRHDWDMLKRQMNYPNDTLPWDSRSTGRLGFIPFNRLHNFADGGTVERPTKMNKKVKHALDVALSETHPKRFHHTLARTGYADGGLPDMDTSPADLANEVPYTHEKALASQFDVAKSAPYKPKGMKLGVTKIAPPKKVGFHAPRGPRSDIGKLRLRKNISVKPKKLKFASGGHPEIDDALRLASRTMSDMAKHIGDEGVHGASMQQGSTSTIVKEKLPGKKSEVVYEHHAKTPTETETFASGGGAWTRKEGQNPEGGLNAKGRASAKAEGHNLKPPAPHPKNDKDASRRDSFCARMKGMKSKLTSAKTANDPDSRINKSLRAWNCRADGGRLMHQDIIDALNLAQRRRHFADGGFGGGSAGPMPRGYIHNMGPDFTPGGRGNDLISLYQQELGRDPDSEGMSYWLQQLRNGMSMDQVQQMFDQSQEGQAYNQQPPRFSNDPRNPHVGGGQNNPFPPGTTPDVMNPKYDPYYGNQPLNDVMPDYPVTMVPPGGMPEIGPGILPGQGPGRPPFPPFPGGGNGTKAGGQGIGGQGPMPKRTPLEELDMMYQSELGRDADEGGRNYWLQQLNNGMSMDQIRNSFDSSQEGQAYNERMRPMIDGPFGVGGGNGTKAGGSGQPSFPLPNPGYPQNPNAPMPNIPPGGQGGGIGGIFNGIGGMGNGTKAGGSGTKAGPSSPYY